MQTWIFARKEILWASHAYLFVRGNALENFLKRYVICCFFLAKMWCSILSVLKREKVLVTFWKLIVCPKTCQNDEHVCARSWVLHTLSVVTWLWQNWFSLRDTSLEKSVINWIRICNFQALVHFDTWVVSKSLRANPRPHLQEYGPPVCE